MSLCPPWKQNHQTRGADLLVLPEGHSPTEGLVTMTSPIRSGNRRGGQACEVRPLIALEVSLPNRRLLSHMLGDSYALLLLRPEEEETVIPPDACLLDELSMERCSRLRELWPLIPLLVFSSLAETKTIVAALDAGADDYLVIPIGEQEVRARLRAHLRRFQFGNQKGTVTSMVSQDGMIRLEKVGRVLWVGTQQHTLSRTAFALLWHFVNKEGAVLSNTFLLEHVWGPAYGDEIGSLRVSICQLRYLLQTATTPGPYIHTESHFGYRFASPDQPGTIRP